MDFYPNAKKKFLIFPKSLAFMVFFHPSPSAVRQYTNGNFFIYQCTLVFYSSEYLSFRFSRHTLDASNLLESICLAVIWIDCRAQMRFIR